MPLPLLGFRIGQVSPRSSRPNLFLSAENNRFYRQGYGCSSWRCWKLVKSVGNISLSIHRSQQKTWRTVADENDFWCKIISLTASTREILTKMALKDFANKIFLFQHLFWQIFRHHLLQSLAICLLDCFNQNYEQNCWDVLNATGMVKNMLMNTILNCKGHWVKIGPRVLSGCVNPFMVRYH